jgi:hypothetical protein
MSLPMLLHDFGNFKKMTEQCGYVIENKGTGLKARRRSRNVIENTWVTRNNRESY